MSTIKNYLTITSIVGDEFIRVILLAVFSVTLIGCQSNHTSQSLNIESLTADEAQQVDILLKNLYQSFMYNEAGEPDWELMRSVFFEGAQFVSEPAEGAPLRPQTIEGFISSWQQAIRNSNSSTVETSEKIIETRAHKIGKLIHVDVVFLASKANDPSPRKSGLDSLVLANVGGVWKVLSFVVQYESKFIK